MSWLDAIIVMNEAAGERVPGKLSIHRSEGDALATLTQWPVLNGRVFAFSAEGTRLVVTIGGDDDFTVTRQEWRDGPEIVHEWLETLAKTTLETRKRDAARGRVRLSRAEQDGALPEGVEGLLAYIGLPGRPGANWFLPGCLALLVMITMLLAAILRRLL